MKVEYSVNSQMYNIFIKYKYQLNNYGNSDDELISSVTEFQSLRCCFLI